MKTPVAKFGGMAGAETKPGVESGGNAFWRSFTSAPPWSQRVLFVDMPDITNTTVSTCPGFKQLDAVAARPEFQSISKAIRFGMVHNMELPSVDPRKPGPVTGVGAIGTDDDALVWNDVTKPLNARWKVAVVANAYPNALPISVFIAGNEPNGQVQRVCAYAPGNFGAIIDSFSNNRIVDQNTAMSRYVALIRAAWEELRTENRQFARQRHPGVVAAYALSGGAMRSVRAIGNAFNAYEYFNYNDGEILKYCDVIDQHFHNYQSAFDVSGVAGGTYSPWHFWTALQQGQALAGTGKIHPVYWGEHGVESGDDDPSNIEPLPAPYQSAWNNPPTAANRPARHLLKTWRLGMSACTYFYWGVSHVMLYQQNATAPDYGHTFCPANNNYLPLEPQWTALCKLFDPESYYVTGPWPWALPITAKPFTDYTNDATKATVGFHYAPTWAILGDLYDAEKSDPMSTTVPAFHEWCRATITDNHIAFTAPVAGQGNQLNRACRPVILPGHCVLASPSQAS
jgi:hypothetical protein